MKPSPASPKVLTPAATLAAVILLLVPFHAFLTVWAGSLFGHYTVWRLWDEALLILVSLGAAVICLIDNQFRKTVIKSRLTWLIAAYLVLQIIWGAAAFGLHHVTAKALGYAWIVNLRFLIFFLAVGVISARTTGLQSRWRPLVFWPAVVVTVVAILQYLVLPYDFLRHFGYSASTIYPYETINHNVNYIRVMSTLRGANPLGAYLVVVLSLLLAYLIRRPAKWREERWRSGALVIGCLLALVFSFSRSAWLAMVLAVIVLAGTLLKTVRAKRLALISLGGLIIVVAATAYAVHGNTAFQNAIFHTSDQSTIDISSNEGHESALKHGLRDLWHEPLGRGPGTAGPASVYNDSHPSRIAENYFIQVGQEVGWLGLALFLVINALVAYALWLRCGQPLALGLFAALLGISFINLLSHAWTDDTLAYIWWGLAGLALAKPLGGKHDNI